MNILKISKQITAMLLVLTMVFSMLPMQAFATEEESTDTPTAVTVTGVALDQYVLDLTAGGSAVLTATVSPEEVSDKRVTWTSDNEAVATVADGTVTAVTEGTANITATTAAGGHTAVCSVTVSPAQPEAHGTPDIPEIPGADTIAVTGISLGQDALSVPLGGYSTLTYTIAPENATNQEVTWTSSDEAVATVADGQVTGVAEGTATITVTTEDGSYNASVTATVAVVQSPYVRSGPAAEATTVYVTIADGNGELAIVQEEVTVTDRNSDGKLNIDEALYAAHETNYSGGADEGYSSYTGQYGLSLSMLWGDSSGNYGYYVNSDSAWSLDNEVKAGDYVDAFIYQNDDFSDKYCYFDSRTISVTAGSELELTLSYWNWVQEESEEQGKYVETPVANAAITIDGGNTSFTTDASGKATLFFDAAGEYTISATSVSETLVAPVCIVTVGEATAEPVLAKLGYYESGEKIIDLTAVSPATVLAESAEYIGLIANFDSSAYTVTASFGEAEATLKNSSGYWDTVNLKIPGFGDNTLTVTVTDTVSGQTVETYSITIQNPEPTYDEDNSLKSIVVEYSNGSYITVPVYQADAEGNATTNSTISNDHKYYTAVLPAGTTGYYLGIGKNVSSAWTQNAFDGGEWEAVNNGPVRSIPDSGTSVVWIRLADDKTYSEKGWNGNESDYNYFTLWVKVEAAAESPKLTGMEFFASDLDAGLTPAFDAAVLEGYTVTPKASKSSISIRVTAPEGCTVTANYLDKSDALSTNGWDSLDGLDSATGNVPVELVVTDPASGLSAAYKLTLVYETTDPADPAKVHVTIADGNGDLVMVQEEVTVTDRNSDGKLDIDEALYAAHEAKYSGGAVTGYSSEESDWGLSITKLWGNTSGSYGYYVNSNSAWSLADEVKTGDYLDAFVYTDANGWSDTYCFFNARTASVEAGSTQTLTLSCRVWDSNQNQNVETPVSGAAITIDGEVTASTTDADGSVTLTFDTAGTYTVSAASETLTLVPPVCVVTVGEKASPFDGAGTQSAPYLLKNAADFDKLDALVESGETFSGKYFKVTADVTQSSGWDGIGHAKIQVEEVWGSMLPVVKEFKPFAGSLDGDNHTLTFPSGSQPLFDCVRTTTIQNLKIKGSIADDGLIANYVQDGSNATASISNVTILSGSKIAGSGFLGGYASSINSVTITNCHIQSGVTIGSAGASNIGGFAGDFNGTITDSSCAATIYGKDFVGGILGGQGQSQSSTVSDCTFSGEIIATGNYVGGISGSGYTGTGWGISSAPNTGCITIQDCTVTGTISGGDYVGGILGAEPGVVQCWENGKASITDNTFTGSLSSSGKYVGGIIGYLNSLNKFQTISGNAYRNAERGIGGIQYVDTSYADPAQAALTTYVNTANGTPGISGMTRTAHNRTDDPLGKDKDALALFMGTSGDPSDPIKPTVTRLTVDTSKCTIRYNQGETLDLTGAVFTATWSDGKTTNPKLNEVTITGYDPQKSGTQTLTATYEGSKCYITVNVIAAPVNTTITVTFSMLGDSAHGEGGSVHTLRNGGLTTWISATQYSMASGSTVLDLLAKACGNNGISYSYTGSFVNSITRGGVTLAAFTNGPNSGWMYTVNGNYSDYSVSEQKLSSGDVVVFHYTDDYNIEYGSSSSGSGTVTQKTPAEKVIDLIKQIGAVSYTPACKQKIDAARAAYAALSAADKSKVTNVATLEAAEKTYADLKKLDDQKQADTVDALINKIKKPITLNSEKEIKAARDAFNKLTKEQQELVRNLQKLREAENKLAELTASGEDKEKAKNVMDLIDAIGEVTADSEEKIKAARTAYGKLTDLQKALVTNLDILEAAEKIFARLEELKDYRDAYNATGTSLAGQELPIGSDWIVLGLVRSGHEVEEDYYKQLVEYIQENADEDMRLHRAKSSDNSRTILSLTALGYDATDVEGINLVAGLNSMDYICKQGINGAFWALIALDCGNYPAPGGDVTRENLCKTIVDAQLVGGGWALSGEISDPDMTGMALQALAPYYDTDTASDVNKAVEAALAYLSRIQNSDGSFSTGSAPAAESIAQVVVALTALGIDPDTDERFIKNGCSALDALLKFYVPGEGFKHMMDGGVNGIATEQAYCALTAYDRFLKNRNRLYDMTDVLDLGGGVLTEETAQEAVVVIPQEAPIPIKPDFFQWFLAGIQNLFSWFTDK